MKTYKKTLFGSLFAFFMGTSCCWMSSLAIWIGGVAFAGGVINFMEEMQMPLFIFGVILLSITILLYKKVRKK